MKAAELVVKGAQCDKPGCDYIDPEAVPSESFVGTQCPKCGSVLLTAEDWQALRIMQLSVDLVNACLGEAPIDAEFGLTPVSMNGTGSIEFGETTKIGQS